MEVFCKVPVLGLISHNQKVKTLYKKSLRMLRSYYHQIWMYRYHATVLRSRFDANKDLKDLRKAKVLLKKGEHELFLLTHPSPMKFQYSLGGTCFERVVPPPDWVLDHWHPLEKAQYPKYFERREKRKKEYLEWWDKYGFPKPMGGPSEDDEPDDPECPGSKRKKVEEDLWCSSYECDEEDECPENKDNKEDCCENKK